MELVKSIHRPVEFASMLKYKLFYKPQIPEGSENLVYCYETLVKVSRSFAAVIQELGPELRDSICIFYLVLRGLDTVEDDTRIPVEKRSEMLLEFYKNIEKPDFRLDDCGDTPDYVELMRNFHRVIDVYLSLKPEYRVVISEITDRMARGMCEFANREVKTLEDWDLYCHYVAGLVGIGLSKMFAASGLEDKSFAEADKLSNSMGLLLQKTNIIRDYLDDVNHDRVFWPSDVWRKYGTKFSDFKDPSNRSQALACLNDLVTNALQHVPDCLEYMSRLRDQNNFNFCAIPQVMAIASLALCYNNPNIFTGVVKIRKGLTAKLIMTTKSIEDVCAVFYQFACEIERKIDDSDPNAAKTREFVKIIKETTASRAKKSKSLVSILALTTAVGVVGYVAYKYRGSGTLGVVGKVAKLIR